MSRAVASASSGNTPAAGLAMWAGSEQASASIISGKSRIERSVLRMSQGVIRGSTFLELWMVDQLARHHTAGYEIPKSLKPMKFDQELP